MSSGMNAGLRGAVLALAAFALFSLSDTCVKWLTGAYPVAELAFGNALLALTVMAIRTAQGVGFRQMATRRLPLHLARGLCLSLNVLGVYGAFSLMPLPDAYAVMFSAPIMITLLGMIFLDERPGWRHGVAVAIGFGGILIMVRPDAGVASLGTAAAMAGTVGYAASSLITRRLKDTETAPATAVYGQLVLVAVTAALAALHPARIAPADLALLGTAGLFNGTAQLCLIEAFRRAPTGIVAPFQYSQLVWGTLAGWLIWRQSPDLWVIGGAALVIVSGAYILGREAQPAPAPEAARG